MWRLLRAARIEPVAMNAVVAAGGRVHLRLALKNPTSGQARAAITTIFSVPGIRNISVFDDDVDIFDSDEVEWAMSTRMKPDGDIIIQSGMPAITPIRHAADGTVAKVGYDRTMLPEQRRISNSAAPGASTSRTRPRAIRPCARRSKPGRCSFPS